jgi:hypothetical protein
LGVGDDERGDLSESRDCLAGVSVDFARCVSRFDGVNSGSNELSRLECGGARLRKANLWITPEPHFARAAREHEAQHPFSRPCRRDDKLQPVIVAMLSSLRRLDFARGELTHVASFLVHKSVHKFQ